jgi:hypothetical protein
MWVGFCGPSGSDWALERKLRENRTEVYWDYNGEGDGLEEDEQNEDAP